MKVLVVNAGSSSLKFTLFDMAQRSVLCKGLVERIGLEAPKLIYQRGEEPKSEEILTIKDHNGALKAVCGKLVDPASGVMKSLNEVQAIGHRVVHGGEAFTDSAVVTEAVKAGIRHCVDLAPLHNPANLGGIEACEQVFPGIVNVAVFDTAFHQSMDPAAYMYAVPKELYRKYGIRKYGFHGTSHKYVYYTTCAYLNLDPAQAKVITCHLGNGGSVAAVKGGKVLDTSMGMTPLMGLVMGTRCGKLDPAVVLFLLKQGYTADQVDALLNKQSGLQGVSGLSSDMRDIEAGRNSGNPDARDAYDMFVHRLICYIGSYYLQLGGADVVAFTGGIGENCCSIRQLVVERMAVFGCSLDAKANKQCGQQVIISTPESRMKVVVTPTNEELMIALDTVKLIEGK